VRCIVSDPQLIYQLGARILSWDGSLTECHVNSDNSFLFEASQAPQDAQSVHQELVKLAMFTTTVNQQINRLCNLHVL